MRVAHPRDDWSKTQIVTGPRRFRRTRTGGHNLTDPEPAKQVPLI